MRMMVLTGVSDLETPGALARRDALRDAFVDEPFERAIKRDTVVGNPGVSQRGANFVM